MGSLFQSATRAAVLTATAMLASPVWADDLQRQVQDSPLFEELRWARAILQQDVLAKTNTLSDPILPEGSQ